jgi:hypothetical protein
MHVDRAKRFIVEFATVAMVREWANNYFTSVVNPDTIRVDIDSDGDVFVAMDKSAGEFGEWINESETIELGGYVCDRIQVDVCG